MAVLVVLLADFSQCELLGRNSIEKLNRTVWSAALTRARARHMTPWLSFLVGSTGGREFVCCFVNQDSGGATKSS